MKTTRLFTEIKFPNNFVVAKEESHERSDTKEAIGVVLGSRNVSTSFTVVESYSTLRDSEIIGGGFYVDIKIF